VLEKDLQLEGSRDRFVTDSKKDSGAAGGAKTWFSLESGTHFHIFGSPKIRYLLDPQKPQFRHRFGSQVGLLKRPCRHQEALGTLKETFFGLPTSIKKEDPKKHQKEANKKTCLSKGTGSALLLKLFSNILEQKVFVRKTGP